MVVTVPTPQYLESIVASIQQEGLDQRHLARLLFSIVDHFCAQQPVPCGPGRPPTYSAATILKLVMLMHLSGKHGETEILREAQRHFPAELPQLPPQSRLWHRIRSAVGLLEHFRRYLRTELGVAYENLRIVDTLPVPVAIPTSRAGKGNGFTLAEGGYCASKKLKYLGFKLGVLVTPQGIPDTYDLFPANRMDVELLDELVTHLHDVAVLGDKGFVSKRRRQRLWAEQRVRLVTYHRKNEHVQATPQEQWVLRTFRQRIETVFAQFVLHLALQRSGAKTDLGLVKRLVGALTAFTLAIYINALLDRPWLHIKELFA
jgi:hypothetical protein